MTTDRSSPQAIRKGVGRALYGHGYDPEKVIRRIEPKPTFIVKRSVTEWLYDHLDKPMKMIDLGSACVAEWTSPRGYPGNANGVAQGFKRLFTNNVLVNGTEETALVPAPDPNVRQRIVIFATKLECTVNELRTIRSILEDEGFKVSVAERVKL